MAGFTIGLAGLVAPSILGVGYNSVSFWLHGGGTVRGTALAFILKTIVFVIALSGGVLGGSFAPSLFIGSALGAAIGLGAHDLFPGAHIDPKAYAIVGMGAAFAGLLRSPIAAVLIAVELTRDYELIVPLMLAVSLSIAVSRRISRFSIVEQQMMDEGYMESHDAGDPLARVRAAEAMTEHPLTIAVDATLAEASRVTTNALHRAYPVVESDGRLAGIVRRNALDAAVSQGRGDVLVRELMEQPKLVATGTEELIEVVRRMEMVGVDRCPVVDDDAARRVIGFLGPSDILRARIARSRSAESEFELFE
jgi:CIC family chloride channel protein